MKYITKGIYVKEFGRKSYTWLSFNGSNLITTCIVGVGFVEVDLLTFRCLNRIRNNSLSYYGRFVGPPLVQFNSQLILGIEHGVVDSRKLPIETAKNRSTDLANIMLRSVKEFESRLATMDDAANFCLEGIYTNAGQTYTLPAALTILSRIDDRDKYCDFMKSIMSVQESKEYNLYISYLNEVHLN